MLSRTLMQTEGSWALFSVRVVLGAVLFPHGAQKLLGWFGGAGFGPTLQSLTGMGLPAAVALLVILIESFGAISLVTGFLARVSALGVIAVMLGAILKVHLAHGFFMNWTGAQQGEGFEYHLLALGMALPIVLFGAGSASIDRSTSEKNRNPYR